MIRTRSGFAALCAIFMAACTLAPGAFAQALSRTGERLSEQQAVEYLRGFFTKRPTYYDGWCGVIATSGPVTSFEISATSVSIKYCGKKSAELTFAELPEVRRCSNCGLFNNAVCVSGTGIGGHCMDAADRQAFANAWLALAHPPPRDPATDTAFQAALQAARAKAEDHSEANRRAQVQVEALLGADRRDEAAASYREALAVSPDWADGHYNLALVAGETGSHVEAITAMKRYLYLKPDAPDARAAQDQIYKWEALLPASRRP